MTVSVCDFCGDPIDGPVHNPHDRGCLLFDPETVAQAFHEAYERLAPSFGYRTREASAVPWPDVPAQNKALMIATVTEVLGMTGDCECDNTVCRGCCWTCQEETTDE